MHTDAITHGDGQRTQVWDDPLDYVLRYAPGDYDCYHQGRYIGSHATLARAITAIEAEQEQAARHPLHANTAAPAIAVAKEELQAVTARLYELTAHLASQPTRRVHLTLAQIQLAAALRSLEAAEHTLTLAQRRAEAPLDAAA